MSKFVSLALSLLLGAASILAISSHAGVEGGRFDDLHGDPGIRSASALVVDANGTVIYGKNVEDVKSIASITKLMTAMVVLDAALDPNEMITISDADRDLVKLTGSRLDFGAILSRKELLTLALMASENRAAAALGRAYPGGIVAFVAAMNAKAQSLGMQGSHFSDPVGLNADNVASAKDLGKMLLAAYKYPAIRAATTALKVEVHPYHGRGGLHYANTNRLLKNSSWQIELSKTGYINEAGRCLVMRAMIEGEPVSIVLLDSFGRLTPFGDSNRLRRWMLQS